LKKILFSGTSRRNSAVDKKGCGSHTQSEAEEAPAAAEPAKEKEKPKEKPKKKEKTKKPAAE